MQFTASGGEICYIGRPRNFFFLRSLNFPPHQNLEEITREQAKSHASPRSLPLQSVRALDLIPFYLLSSTSFRLGPHHFSLPRSPGTFFFLPHRPATLSRSQAGACDLELSRETTAIMATEKGLEDVPEGKSAPQSGRARSAQWLCAGAALSPPSQARGRRHLRIPDSTG